MGFFMSVRVEVNSNLLANIRKMQEALADSNAVVVGAGAGLSTSASFVYTGARVEQYFSDFGQKYGFKDMYSGGILSLPYTGRILSLLEPLYLCQPFIWIRQSPYMMIC